MLNLSVPIHKTSEIFVCLKENTLLFELQYSNAFVTQKDKDLKNIPYISRKSLINTPLHNVGKITFTSYLTAKKLIQNLLTLTIISKCLWFKNNSYIFAKFQRSITSSENALSFVDRRTDKRCSGVPYLTDFEKTGDSPFDCIFLHMLC